MNALERAKTLFCIPTVYQEPTKVVALGLRRLEDWCYYIGDGRNQHFANLSEARRIKSSNNPNNSMFKEQIFKMLLETKRGLTLSEITKSVGCSQVVAREHIKALMKKGEVELDPNPDLGGKPMRKNSLYYRAVKS